MLSDVTQEELVSRGHDSSFEFRKRVVALQDTEDTQLRHRKLSYYFTVVRRIGDGSGCTVEDNTDSSLKMGIVLDDYDEFLDGHLENTIVSVLSIN